MGNKIRSLILLLFFAFLGCKGQGDVSKTVDDENKTEIASDTTTDGGFMGILYSPNPETPEGWEIVDSKEFKCRVPWPKGKELTGNSNIEFDDGKVNFFFGSGERSLDHQQDYTLEAICNLTELSNQIGHERLFSESNESFGFRISDYGYKNDESTVFGRVIAGKENYWSIVSVFPNGQKDDPRIAYFFSRFEHDE